MLPDFFEAACGVLLTSGLVAKREEAIGSSLVKSDVICQFAGTVPPALMQVGYSSQDAGKGEKDANSYRGSFCNDGFSRDSVRAAEFSGDACGLSGDAIPGF